MSRIAPIVITFVSLIFCVAGAEAAGTVECTRTGFQQLYEDANETNLYKDTMAERACVGRKVRPKGAVLNIDGQRDIKITAEDGFEYRVILSPAHNCGDILKVKKGQKLQVTGTVTKAYLSIFTLRIEDAYCVAPIN